MRFAYLILLVSTSANVYPKGPRVTPHTYNFIRHQEKLSLVAYPDVASPRALFRRSTGVDDPSLDGTPWTVGYGSTGPSITEGTRWTKRRADIALERRVDKLAELLNKSVTAQLSQEQFDAVISFAYNLGSGVLKPGSRLVTLLNGRDFEAVGRMMRRYTMARGARFVGLVARRELEAKAFNQTFD